MGLLLVRQKPLNRISPDEPLLFINRIQEEEEKTARYCCIVSTRKKRSAPQYFSFSRRHFTPFMHSIQMI